VALMPDSNHLMAHCKCHGPAICRENGSPHGWPDWKVALITGASRGQGEAEAPPFAERTSSAILLRLPADHAKAWDLNAILPS